MLWRRKEGSVDLEASGYIEMTDLNIDDANISINTGGEATIGWAAQPVLTRSTCLAVPQTQICWA